MKYFNIILLIFGSFLFSSFLLIERGGEVDNVNEYSIDGSCTTRYYPIFSAFRKVIDSEKYKCYGKPSGYWQSYECPMKKRGRCQGSYVKQEFCYKGKTVNLYHSDTKCTCGCVGKNFHGKSLDILDLSACGCDDDLDETIGVGF